MYEAWSDNKKPITVAISSAFANRFRGTFAEN
jgi:hypothetical protein